MPALGLIGSCVTVLAVVLGLPFGAVGVAAAYALSGLCLRVPFLFWVVGRRGPVSSSDLYRAMMPAAVASSLVLVVIWSLRKLHLFAAMTPLEMLFATGFIAMALALAAYLILPQGREATRDFRRLSGFFLKRGANA